MVHTMGSFLSLINGKADIWALGATAELVGEELGKIKLGTAPGATSSPEADSSPTYSMIVIDRVPVDLIGY